MFCNAAVDFSSCIQYFAQKRHICCNVRHTHPHCINIVREQSSSQVGERGSISSQPSLGHFDANMAPRDM